MGLPLSIEKGQISKNLVAVCRPYADSDGRWIDVKCIRCSIVKTVKPNQFIKRPSCNCAYNTIQIGDSFGDYKVVSIVSETNRGRARVYKLKCICNRTRSARHSKLVKLSDFVCKHESYSVGDFVGTKKIISIESGRFTIQCRCGNQDIVSREIMHSRARSLGCMKCNVKAPPPVPGEKLGNWTIHSGTRSKCIARCVCGILVESSHAELARTKMCIACRGKAQTERAARMSDPEIFGPDLVWNSYRVGAETRSIEFELEKDEFFIKLITSNCYYCGSAPQLQKKKFDKFFVHTGIDRINSTTGYTKENVVACCTICNKMKSNLTTDNFYKHIEKIYHRIGGD